MKTTIDLGEPTITLRCKRRGCKRAVGPYFTLAEADKAMAVHDLIRHVAVYPARECPSILDRDF